MNIQGFQKTTLLDYPKHVAATVFFGGCNFCCPFCHNSGLVLAPESSPAIPPKEVLAYLKKRQKILDGVCITGGEPTLQEELTEFLTAIKGLGLSVKLDTNGYRPQVLKELCSSGLVDYVAMDIKGAPAKYAEICGRSGLDFQKIAESVDFLMEGSVEYEFRTTVVRELHSIEDFSAIGAWLSSADVYYLQSYQDSPQVISPGFHAYTLEELTSIQKLLLKNLSRVELRGMAI